MSDPHSRSGADESTVGCAHLAHRLDVVDRVDVGQFGHQVHVKSLRIQRGQGQRTDVGRDIGTSRRQSAIDASETPSTHHPPSSASPSTASVPISSAAHSTIISADTCGVSMPIWEHPPVACGCRSVGMGVGEALGEIVSALRYDGERLEATADLIGRAGGVEISNHRHHPRLYGGCGDRVEGVQQRSRRDVGGRPIPDQAASRDLASPRRGVLVLFAFLPAVFHDLSEFPPIIIRIRGLALPKVFVRVHRSRHH